MPDTCVFFPKDTRGHKFFQNGPATRACTLGMRLWATLKAGSQLIKDTRGTGLSSLLEVWGGTNTLDLWGVQSTRAVRRFSDRQALCTIDVGGAVAYFLQAVTWINLIVVHCEESMVGK